VISSSWVFFSPSRTNPIRLQICFGVLRICKSVSGFVAWGIHRETTGSGIEKLRGGRGGRIRRMGTVVVPNSAAAALLSLQISMVQSMKGRKRMGVEEDWEETKMGQEEGGGGRGGGQQLLKLPCESEVPLDVLAHCFLHLSSFSDMAS
jgi:hypothetical protein